MLLLQVPLGVKSETKPARLFIEKKLRMIGHLSWLQCLPIIYEYLG